MIALAIIVLVFWWSVIGAVVLACLQDSHRASDDRDPMIVDLPLWQILACGPVAWAIRFVKREPVQRDIMANLRALERCSTVQLIVTILIGLTAAVMFYAGYVFEATGGWR